MRAVPPICIGLGKRIICQFLDGGDSSHLKEPASAPQRGYPPAAGPEERQALFEPPQGGGKFGRRPEQSPGGSARSQALIFCSWHFDFSGIRELVAVLLGWSFLGQPTTRKRGSSRTQLKIKVK